MRLKISHTTTYSFDAPVPFGLQQLRKMPKSFRNQTIASWTTNVEGGNKELSYDDFHRNRVELISLTPNTESVTLVSEGLVDIEDNQGVIGPHEGQTPLWLFQRATLNSRFEFTSPTLKASKAAVSSPKNSRRTSSRLAVPTRKGTSAPQ